MNIFKSGFISIFFVSMLPFVEVKGGLVLGATLGLNQVTSFFVCLLASSIIIPPLLFIIYPLFNKLRQSKMFSKIANNYLNKAKISKQKILQKELENSKRAKALNKKNRISGFFKYFSLFCFVAIPLPGTGVYSGCLLASIMNLNKLKAGIVVFLGNVVSTLLASLAIAGVFLLF